MKTYLQDALDTMQGRRFLVTGATSGAGLQVAKDLDAMGAEVVLCGRDEEKLNKTAETFSPNARILRIDFTEINNANKARARIINSGPFDGVFHAAGVEMVRPISMHRDEPTLDMHNVSCNTAFELLRMHRELFPDGPASFVAMSSVAAQRGAAYMTGYAMGKAAIEGLVRAAAAELAPRIRVNAIAAGAFDSPMHRRVVGKQIPEATDAYVRRHPLGIGTCHDVADMAVFLLSDAAKWVTGAVIPVDGGYLVG